MMRPDRPRAPSLRGVGVLGLAAAALVLAGATPAAHADTGASCTVLEIEASTSDAPSVDPDLRPLERKLKKPPFSSWNTFKRLGSHDLVLQMMKAGSLGLTQGKLELLLREATAGGSKKPRVSLGLTLDDQDGKRVIDTKLVVDAGAWLAVGRSLKGKENHGQIVALTCKL
jgi:hypothetical protein